MKQTAVTIVASFPYAQATDRKARLEYLGKKLEQNPEFLAFVGCNRVHFVSFFVIEPKLNGVGPAPAAADVVLELNWDGRRSQCHRELAQHAGALLAALFDGCDGYKPPATTSFLRRHDIGAGAFYVGNPGRTVERIRREASIRPRLLEVVHPSPGQGRAFSSSTEAWAHLQHSARQLSSSGQRNRPLDLSEPEPPRPFWVRWSLHPKGARPRLRKLWTLYSPLALRAAGLAALVATAVVSSPLPAATACLLGGPFLLAGALVASVWAVELPVHRKRRSLLSRGLVWDWLSLSLTIAGLVGALSLVPWLVVAVPVAQSIILGALGLALLALAASFAYVAAGAWTGWAFGLIATSVWLASVGLHLFTPATLAFWGGAMTLALALPATALSAFVLLAVRRRELRDEEGALAWDLAALDENTQCEDVAVQNHLATVSVIKPGWVSRYALRAVLRLLTVVITVYANRGDLAGISSIHFGRFVILPDAKRLLFLGNYDGGFGAYLTRFCSVIGTTAVWSNTEGFPRSWLLAGDGGRDEQRFKAFGRRDQVRTLGWWSAYPRLTVQDIDAASATREDLERPIADSSDLFSRCKRAFGAWSDLRTAGLRATLREVGRQLRDPLDGAACDAAMRRLY